jgi:murein L,D-transpeptidase YafK
MNLKIILTLLLLFIVILAHAQILERHLAYGRVKDAKEETDVALKKLFESKGLIYPSKEVFFRAFKKDNLFEMWAKDTKTGQFVLVKSYEICYASGELGPKRRRGDYQVPEGFYYVDYYNPQSSFHLAVRVNYPNDSDKKLSKFKDWGSDICIHGSCVSIGCISITDEKIKEVYWVMIQAHAKGQAKVPVHIFPTILTSENLEWLKEEYKEEKDKIALWDNLKEGYDFFEKNKKLPIITVNTQGKYVFK